jgi:hypothetical protein
VEKASSFFKNIIHILVAGKTCSFDFKGTLTHRIAEKEKKKKRYRLARLDLQESYTPG